MPQNDLISARQGASRRQGPGRLRQQARYSVGRKRSRHIGLARTPPTENVVAPQVKLCHRRRITLIHQLQSKQRCATFTVGFCQWADIAVRGDTGSSVGHGQGNNPVRKILSIAPGEPDATGLIQQVSRGPLRWFKRGWRKHGRAVAVVAVGARDAFCD